MVMRNGEDMDHVVADQVGHVVREPRYRQSSNGEVWWQSLHGRARMRPSTGVLDGPVNRGEELQTKAVTLVLVPDRCGFELGCRVGMDRDRATHPLVSRPAIRSRTLPHS